MKLRDGRVSAPTILMMAPSSVRLEPIRSDVYGGCVKPTSATDADLFERGSVWKFRRETRCDPCGRSGGRRSVAMIALEPRDVCVFRACAARAMTSAAVCPQGP